VAASTAADYNCQGLRTRADAVLATL
jgi:hypothetical protein